MKDKPIIFVISVVFVISLYLLFVICTTTVQASDFNILFRNWKPAIVF